MPEPLRRRPGRPQYLVRHVETYHRAGVTLEEQFNGREPAASLGPHFHEDYQIVLAEHRIVEYRYRGVFRRSPIGTVFIAHPGEVHSAEVLQDLGLSRPLRD